MKALIYVTEPVAWTEETLASYERISSDGRRRKAEKLKNLPDRVRCIRAGILLAQAYAYEKNRQMIREPAEADSLLFGCHYLPYRRRRGWSGNAPRKRKRAMESLFLRRKDSCILVFPMQARLSAAAWQIYRSGSMWNASGKERNLS